MSTGFLSSRGVWAFNCGGFSGLGTRALEDRFSSCGARAYLLSGTWDLPGPGMEPAFHALTGRFLTTGPPGKSLDVCLIGAFVSLEKSENTVSCIEDLSLRRLCESLSVTSDSLQAHGPYGAWNSPGQDTGVGSQFPSPGDLPNPGIECRSPALQEDSSPAEPPGKPW